MPADKITLNEDQKKAVEFKNGSLLVVAGAGTGKTRVITQRIKHLIKKKKVDPQEILALTFTDKAAGEMLERIGDIMPLGYEEPWVSTFHSFADRILRREGLEIGLDPGYKILSGSSQWILFRKFLFDFDLKYFRPLGNPTKFISAILKFISRTQDENISTQELLEYAKNFKGEKEEKERLLELAKVYKKYEEIRIQNSKMDFGDLITWTIRLFHERPNILKKYQNQFKHVLVDEFQDTNYAQYELIKLLCPPEELEQRSLLVVGDDSQSIYKFRGAAVSNILDFRQDFPKSEMVTLLKNYRSSQNILDSAYDLIRNNNPDTLETKLGISKKLEGVNAAEKGTIAAYQTENFDDEALYVVRKILEILGKEPEYTYKDIAILARANNHLDPFVLTLKSLGLPYQLVGNRGLYDQDEVRDILAFLRILINPEDSISLYRVLNIDSLEVSPGAVAHLLSQSRMQKVSLWTLVGSYSDEKVRNFFERVTSFQSKLTEMSPSELVYNVVNSIDYLSQFVKEETVENQLKIKNLDLFLNKVKQFEVDFRFENKESPTIVDFVDQLDLMIEAGDNPAQAEIEDIDTINLMTVHAAKGLEFPVVFMVNLVGNRFPTRNRGEPIQLPDELVKETLPTGNEHIQEERRLFYVGMTRAKKYLHFMLSKNYGGKRETVPSGFISEANVDIEPINAEDIKKEERQMGIFGVESGFRDAKAQPITDFTPKFLSYSQISMYQTCPLQYKYSYILNIPRPPSHALSFGITIHDTLRDFHSQKMFDKEVSYEDLIKMYEKNWQPLGYEDEKHRQERFESGKELLKDYYEKHKDDKKPLGLEKSFNIRIDGIKFYGRIDRIDSLDDGVEIIDYKTGKTKTQKEVDKDDQVAYYALGVKEALKMNPKKLSYYFVESGEKISTTRAQEQLDEKKKEVHEVVENMKSGNFKADPGMQCRWCDYSEICPFAFKG